MKLAAASLMILTAAAYAQMPMRWVPAASGFPQDAASTGSYSVCHGAYQGGFHPGFLLADGCHITWGGNVIVLPQYQTLAGQGGWAAPAADFAGAFQAGHENNAPLYLCMANLQGIAMPGKVVNGACNVAWRGQELPVSQYAVFYAAIRSLMSNQPVRATFRNSTAAPVTYYWIDYNGLAKRYGEIAPGQDVTLDTFATHPWLFDQRGRRIALYVSTSQPIQFFNVTDGQPAYTAAVPAPDPNAAAVLRAQREAEAYRARLEAERVRQEAERARREAELRAQLQAQQAQKAMFIDRAPDPSSIRFVNTGAFNARLRVNGNLATDTVMAGGSRDVSMNGQSISNLQLAGEYDTFFSGWKQIFHGTVDSSYLVPDSPGSRVSVYCVKVYGTAISPQFGRCN